MTARDSATAARASIAAAATPPRAPVCASTTPSGSTTLAPPRKRSRPQRPGLIGGHPDHLVLDRARAVHQVEVPGLAVVANPAGGRDPVHRPGGQRADDVGAVERQRPRRLREQLVVTDQHPDPADRRVERGKAVARRVGEALRRRQVDLALVAEDAVAGHADRRGVQPARAAPPCIPRTRPGPRRVPPGARSPAPPDRATAAGRCPHRPPVRLHQVAPERALGEHHEPGPPASGGREQLLDRRENGVEVTVEPAETAAITGIGNWSRGHHRPSQPPG